MTEESELQLISLGRIVPSPHNPRKFEARFWRLADRAGGPDACWPWTGATANSGYGQFHVGGQTHLAHRVACVIDGRPPPADLVVDHTCRNRLCVNPRHLEVVTARENLLRTNSCCAINAKKETCIRGHVYDEANTIHTANGRECRACRRERERSRPRRDRRRYFQAYFAGKHRSEST